MLDLWYTKSEERGIPMIKKIAVGMSGGVDSSVAAYILKKEGHEVFGCNLKMYVPKNGHLSEDTKDAGKVCDTLGVGLGICDCTSGFDGTVIKNFTDTYLAGKTPNPCVFCNRNMKFPSMIKYAESIGCTHIATGHYARIKEQDGRFLLLRGVDRKKDQSYMLYLLTQDILSKTLFPLGELTKDEIRDIARNIGLSVAEKKDSQDICFISKGDDYAEFIKERTQCDILPGDFVDMAGNVVGRHKGIISYTVGQRKGLGIASTEPYYVVGKDVEACRVILGREGDLYTKRVFVKNPNFIPFDTLTDSIRVTAKLRYSQNDSVCTAFPVEDGIVLEFDEEQRAVTPGQSAVLYDGDVVIGGGEIDFSGC